MSIQVLCPSCGQVAELQHAPVRVCPHCQALFTPAIQKATEEALRRERRPKPFLLTLGQGVSMFAGSLLVLLTLMAPFDIGTFRINGEQMSGPEFLRNGGWLLLVLGGLLVVIGVGLWRERTWSRPLMIIYWLSMSLMTFIGHDQGRVNVVTGVVMSVGLAVIAAWYLYRKAHVRAYYAAREALDRAR